MPPPLPLPPTAPPPPPPRLTRPRYPGYLALAAVVFGLTLLLVYGLRKADEIKADAERANAAGGVKAVLLAQQDAWNAGDLDGFMAGYWNDDRLTFASGGDITRGWQATTDRYRKRYQADGKEMGALAFTDLEVEPLGPEALAALARGRWGLTFAKSEDRPSGLFTLILRKTPDGWKIVHDHTSVPEPKKN